MPSKPNSIFLWPLALLFILGIGIVIGRQSLSSLSFSDGTNILGAVSDKNGGMFQFVQDKMDGALEDTREKLTAKSLEAEQEIMSTVDTEIKSMTESQIRALKLHICENWGVVPKETTQNEN